MEKHKEKEEEKGPLASWHQPRTKGGTAARSGGARDEGQPTWHLARVRGEGKAQPKKERNDPAAMRTAQ